MPDISSAVSNLKTSLGLPTAGVKQQVMASPPITGANRPTINNPASQIDQARAILDGITSQSASAPPVESEQARAIEAKDRALQEEKQRSEQLNAALQSQTEQITKLVEQLSADRAPSRNAPPEPPLPGLPENLTGLPVEEQLKTMMESYTKLQSELQSRLNNHNESLKKFLSPLGNRMRELSEWQEAKQIAETYPKFRLDEFKQKMGQYRAEMPGMTALEAAELVAAKNDPSMLMPDDAVAPVVEASRAPIHTASGNAGIQNPQSDQYASAIAQLNAVARAAHGSGQSVLAGNAIDQILKLKLGRK